MLCTFLEEKGVLRLLASVDVVLHSTSPPRALESTKFFPHRDKPVGRDNSGVTSASLVNATADLSGIKISVLPGGDPRSGAL